MGGSTRSCLLSHCLEGRYQPISGGVNLISVLLSNDRCHSKFKILNMITEHEFFNSAIKRLGSKCH